MLLRCTMTAHGPTRTYCDAGFMSALKERSGLDMLSQRFSEPDPYRTFENCCEAWAGSWGMFVTNIK
jgi:hypothetical protein